MGQAMETGQANHFGALLRRYRRAAGLSQEELAELAGVSQRSIGDLERGAARRPHRDTMALLADALGLAAAERAALEAAGRRGRGIGPDRPPPRASPETPPLVGRARELELLAGHLGGEGPPALLLAGEPGIGKSRLLSEAARRAAGQGWTVLEGGCQRRGGQEPFAPLLEALEGGLRGRTPAQVRAALQGCAWLVRLLPELAEGPIEPLPSWMLSPEQERRLVVKAVACFLANLAGPAGTLLVLDDLQWAGADALDLLTTLLRATESPLRVVGAYRDTEVDAHDPLGHTLADLARGGLARRHMPAPLRVDEVGQVLAALLDGTEAVGLAERVTRRTGGIPFFVVSCAQGLRRDDENVPQQAIPWDVEQNVRQRVALLPAVAREVLCVAAIVGRVVPPMLLTAAVEQPDRAVLAALDTCCRERLLVEVDEGYQFAHDLIQEVVEADVGQTRRLVLHRRIGEALERQASALSAVLPVAALAYHFVRSDAQDKALLYLELAGDSAREHGALAAAADHYRELVERLDTLGRVLDGARVREKLGNVLATARLLDTALEVLERAAATLRTAGDVEALGRVAARMAQLYADRGRVEDVAAGVELLQPLLAPLEERGPSASLGALYWALAHLRCESGEFGAALEAATRAAEVARAAGDDGMLAEAEMSRAYVLCHVGQDSEEMPALHEACRLAEAAGRLDILWFALWCTAWMCGDRGEFDAAQSYAARALALADRLSDPFYIAASTIRLGALAFFMGDWDQARGHFQRVKDLLEPMPEFRWDLLLQVGRVCLAEGAWEQAGDYLEECSTIVRRNRSLSVERTAQSYLAERDLLEGRPGDAHARLLPLLDRNGVEEHGVTTYVLPALAWAYLDLGDIAQAERTIAAAIRRARAAGYRFPLVGALRIQALVALRQGDAETAAQALEEGLDLARAMPYPHGEGRLLQVYGELHLRRGEREAARERFEAALAIFRRLGARKDAEQAEQAQGGYSRPRVE